jgi:hypothetical protein
MVKSFSVPLQNIRDNNGNTHPWYMSGSASVDPSGSVLVTTHLESHIALSGFTGGMVASFMNTSGQALFVTPILQYGVDGYSVPSWLGGTPSPRDASASFQVNADVYTQTDKIEIFLFHAGKNRLGLDIGKALPTIMTIVGWIVTICGAVAAKQSEIIFRASSPSLSNITTQPLKIASGAKYAIHVAAGEYLTAVNGGGIGEPGNKLPLHTDAKQVGPWEKFRFVNLFGDVFAIQTVNGHYLTAVNGGGKGEPANKLPLHTDATQVGPWEVFTLAQTNDGYITMQTSDGHYVTAVNGGGIGEAANTLPLHTDASQISVWEKFTLAQR